ncbi:MAG TPA: ATP-grasp domain-containing protein [Trebonia sp.]|jgi:hypothetical protein
MRFAVLGLPRSRHLKSLILAQLAQTSHTFLVCEERNREFIDGGWAGVEPGSNTEIALLDRLDEDDLAARLVREHVERIISLSDRTMGTAARIRERLGLPGNTAASERWVTDKGLMRRRLLECGLTAVESRRTTVAGLAATVDECSFPVIVKPASLGASLCVELLRSREDVGAYAERCRANRVFTGGDLVVEDYVPGPELSVEGVVANGRVTFFGVTESHHSGFPYYVGTGHDFFPAHERAEAIQDFVRPVLAALEITDSLFHIELKCLGDRYEVIEAHTRFAGTMIAELVRYGTGIEVFAHYADLLAGMATAVPRPRHEGIVAQHLLCSAPGAITHIDLPEEIARDPRVISWSLDYAPGDLIEPDVLPVEYVGYVTFAVTSREQADAFRSHCDSHFTLRLAQESGISA